MKKNVYFHVFSVYLSMGKETNFFHAFSVYLTVGLSNVCIVGTHTSAYSWNLSKPRRRQVKNTIRKRSFLSFPPKVFTLMVDIIILNPIGSFKVDFDCTFF